MNYLIYKKIIIIFYKGSNRWDVVREFQSPFYTTEINWIANANIQLQASSVRTELSKKHQQLKDYKQSSSVVKELNAYKNMRYRMRSLRQKEFTPDAMNGLGQFDSRDGLQKYYRKNTRKYLNEILLSLKKGFSCSNNRNIRCNCLKGVISTAESCIVRYQIAPYCKKKEIAAENWQKKAIVAQE